MIDLGYREMWKSVNQQAIEENWDKEKRTRIFQEVQEGINAEIQELKELGVLRK